MRLLAMLGLILLALFLQITVLNEIMLLGVKPDLLLMLVVFYAFLRGPREGGFLGFTAGLMADLAIGRYIGLNALSYLAVGCLVGLLESKLYKESSIIIVVLTGAASFLGQLVYYSLLAYSGIYVSPMTALSVMLSSSVYTALLVPLFYKKFHRSSTRGWLSGRET